MIISTAVAIADARRGKLGERVYSGRSRAIFERGYIAFKSSTWMVILSGFVEPVLYLFAFGYGLGKLIGNIESGGLSIPYAAYIAPALLATSAMNGAIYDSTMNIFFKLNHDRIYHGMLATSLGPLLRLATIFNSLMSSSSSTGSKPRITSESWKKEDE